MIIRKFTIIGGGSAYVPGLMMALIRKSRRLHLDEIRLYDTDTRRLGIVTRLCSRLADANKAGFSVKAAEDINEAVNGTDAVLNNARPGGFECRKIDEALPLEFSIPGQETVGPGGFFFALRSVPQALDLARAVKEHAPGAVFLNYTNPTNIVTQALRDQGFSKVIGLCDQSEEDLATLGSALGIDHDHVRFDCSGLNHATWYTGVRFNGHTPGEIPEDLAPPGDIDDEHKIRFALSRELAGKYPGYWPNSYIPYYIVPKYFTNFFRKNGTRTDAILDHLDDYYEHFKKESEKDIPDLQIYRGSSGFGDLAVRVLSSLSDASPSRLVVNMPNLACTSIFDPETVIECIADISTEGINQHPAPYPPGDFNDFMEQLESYQRMTAEAAVNGDAGAAAAALALNPLVADRDTAKAMLQRAQQEYGGRIPMFS